MSSPSNGALVTRRRLMLGGVALGVAAAGGFLATQVPLEPAAPGRAVLSDADAVLITALGQCIFPVGNPIGVDWDQVDGTALVDHVLDFTLSDQAVAPFRHSLRGLDWAARMGHGAPLVDLSPGDRLELLLAWSVPTATARRLAVDGVKAVLGLAFFNHPQVLDAVGFNSRCHQ